MYSQECDTLTGEPAPNCHRCPACKGQFLFANRLPAKSTAKRRPEITRVAGGALARGRLRRGPIVTWDADGSNVRPGPSADKYEPARKECNSHLLFNAFWMLSFFCVHQMIPRDPMHQIDLGVILHLIRAILRKYEECVENVLGIPGRAAAKLGERFRNMLKRHAGMEGQRCEQFDLKRFVEVCRGL